jgi:hypothetical protein
MENRFWIAPAVLCSWLVATSQLQAAGVTITSLPATDQMTCFPKGAQSYTFTANWGALIVAGKPWPTYQVAPKGCRAPPVVDCGGKTRCSVTITCGAKEVGATVWIAPLNAVDAQGKPVHTSRATTGGARKPPACK